MDYYILIIDDEQPALADARRVVEGIKRTDLTVETFTDVNQASAFIDTHHGLFMVLCDLEMPGIDGIEAASLLRGKCHRFVYLTGHANLLDKANDTEADAFLLKPLRLKQFLRQQDRMFQSIRSEFEYDTLRFVNDGSKKEIHSIRLEDIQYIHSAGDYIELFLPGESQLVYQTMKGFMEQIGIAARFIRISKTVIVSKRHILSINEGFVKIKGVDRGFLIGRAFTDTVKRYWKNRQLGRSYKHETHGKDKKQSE